MKQQLLFNQIEITFWNLLVLLLSESKTAQALVVSTYKLAPLKWLGRVILGYLTLVAAGWLCGYILGWLHTCIA